MRYPVQTVGDTSFVNSRVLATGSCRLVALVGYNSGADCFIMVFERAAALSLANSSLASPGAGTVTVTTSAAHGYVPGQTVAITGSAAYSGHFTILTVPDAHSFTYASAGVPENSNGITVTPYNAKFSFSADAARPFAFALPNPVDMDYCTAAASSTADFYTALGGGAVVAIQGLLAS